MNWRYTYQDYPILAAMPRHPSTALGEICCQQQQHQQLQHTTALFQCSSILFAACFNISDFL
uniref:Uncharacterized protein n=1 Tax=Glossina pallidipes TaxID=7398 RepID=A0A1B0A3U6_GLOPL